MCASRSGTPSTANIGTDDGATTWSSTLPWAPWADTWTQSWTRAITLGDVMSANGQPAAQLHLQAARRARQLIEHARKHSPFYAKLYRDVPPGAALGTLPVVTRQQLMARFDDWATDRAITLASAQTFVRARDNLAQDYLGRYAVWTSSGTCGQQGVFVQPQSALAVYDAELSTRAHPGTRAAAFASRWPAALICALDGHYGGVVTWRRLQRANPWLAAQMHALSVKEPLEVLVAQLDRIQPRFIAAYPSVLHALAQAQMEGRLRIAPTLLWSGGEALMPAARTYITQAFGCELVNDYAASECMSIAFECPHGRMHLNADWVVLEAVDEHYRPVPAGKPSHTSVLTNLANPVQPLIRYDLGDSITPSADPCPCGCARPAFTVSGRSADVLHLKRADGGIATLFPLAIESVLEEAAQVTQFQLVQTAPNRLNLRLAACHRAQPRQAQKACRVLHEFLLRHGAGQVRVVLDDALPCAEQGSGKVRQVMALSC